MPLKGKYGTAFPPTPPQEEKGMLDTYSDDLANFGEDTGPVEARLRGFGAGALQGVKGLLGMAPAVVRGGSGVLAAEGGLSGAAISGLGELGAETLEGSIFKQHPARTLARTGVAAGLGAVPFSAIFKPGQALASAGLGAAYSGIGEGAREIAAGEDPSLGRIATSAGIGGATGGVLSKFLGGPKGSAPSPAAKAEEYIIEPTDRGFGAKGRTNPKQPYGPKPIKAQGGVEQPYGPFPANTEGPVPYTGTPAEASGRVQKVMSREETQKSALGKLFDKGMKDRDKAFQAEQNAARIQDEITEKGLQPSEPSISESVSVPTAEGGRRSMRTRFEVPEEPKEGGGTWQEDEAGNVIAQGTSPRNVRPISRHKDAPPANTPTGDIYDAWMEKGVGHKGALSNAARGLAPKALAEKVPGTPAAIEGEASPLARTLKATTPSAPGGVDVSGWSDQVLLKQAANDGIPDMQAAARAELAKRGVPFEAPTPVVPEAPPPVPGEIITPEASPLAQTLGVTPKARPSKVQRFNKGVEDIVSKSEAGPPPIEPPSPVVSEPTPPTTPGAGGVAVAEPPAPVVPPTMASSDELDPIAQKMFGFNYDELTSSQMLKVVKASQEGGEVPVISQNLGNLENLGTSQGHEMIPDQASPMNLFRGRVEASGQSYNALQKMFKAGEVPNDVARLAGRAASREARAAEGANPNRPVEVPPAPSVPPQPTPPSDVTGGSWVEDALNEIKKFKGDESGAIDPALAVRLGSGAAGALVGGATDPLGNRPASMLAGGAAGFVAPDIAKGLMALSGGSAGVAEALANFNSSNLKETAQKIFKISPQVQRFNYLMDPEGLADNAIVGPYGSATMGAIEHALSGDARGIEALKRLSNIKQYAQDFYAARHEAAQRVQHGEMGRGETAAFQGEPTVGQRVLQGPGVMMTAGDVAASNLLQASGFSEAEARRIVLTSEAELPLPRWIGHGAPGSTLGQLFLPFRRTPANIWEQGGQRIPGVGFAVQAARENKGFTPDPLRQQLVQQGLGGVLGVGSAAVSSQLDPQSARHARRFASNFAGQYSLPVTMGFAAGQAIRAGQTVPEAAGAAGIAGVRDLPLPTTDTVTQWFNYLTGNGPIPNGAMPKLIKDMVQGDNSATSLGTLPPLETLRIRRQ